MLTGKKKTTTEKTPKDAGLEPAMPRSTASRKKASGKAAKTRKADLDAKSLVEMVEPESSDYSYFENIQLTIDKKKYFERPIATKEELQEIRDKMEADVKVVKELMARLEGYLRSRVDAISINARQFEIMIPIDYMSLKFTTILSVHPQWVFIKCKLMDLEDMPDKVRHELYERILVANFELNAVFYSVDPDLSAVWVENDIATTCLDMKVFEIEFNAIIFGIRYFVDSIALPLNQEMKSTFDSTSMYT
ncbi:MAG: hypothetical protein Q6373_010280 [Candidatus Sigynarchaeota archaeon]